MLVCRYARVVATAHRDIAFSRVGVRKHTLLIQRTVRAAGEASSSTHQACIDTERQGRDASALLPREAFAKCSKEARATRDALMEGRWVRIALIAFAPAIAWLLVYGLIAFVGSRRP